MIVYVGYVMSDYAQAVCMRLNEEKVKEKMQSYPTESPKWIDKISLSKNNIVELSYD